ncbi:MIT C-terminal domain-containing protein [Zafaria sp. Z1313]|uniref:MIT C-terminal domain-containing protein n=1 Tax=unclassified Zafaria TaxID=2828765 RepID=UPI002E765085|nr:MIT C-terminal domain-containing protein [Zafaria sp. J156]MEE1623020.1 MIT C-terminal domain-containing protein [Zafaria sp. J156]
MTFDYSFDGSIHDPSITTDTGWKIILGRGLDIFQYFPNDAFDLVNRLQECRQVKALGGTGQSAPETEREDRIGNLWPVGNGALAGHRIA